MMLVINADELKKLTRALAHIKNGVPRVVVPAIKRALSSGKTVISREIRKEYLIKAMDIPMKIDQPNYSTMGGSIVIRSGMLPLGKFKVTGGLGGRKLLHAQVKKGGGGDIRRGFMLGGSPFARRGASRLPIKKLMTIGAPIMASQPNVGPAANKAMGDTFAKRMDHELVRVLNSAGGR
jgi:hypothetical protein